MMMMRWFIQCSHNYDVHRSWDMIHLSPMSLNGALWCLAQIQYATAVVCNGWNESHTRAGLQGEDNKVRLKRLVTSHMTNNTFFYIELVASWRKKELWEKTTCFEILYLSETNLVGSRKCREIKFKGNILFWESLKKSISLSFCLGQPSRSKPCR